MEKIPKRISVWFVTGSLPPSFSGAGRNDLLLASLCSDHGLDITLVSNRQPGDPCRDIIKGVPILRIPMGDHKILSRVLGPLNLLRHLFRKPRPLVLRFRGFSFGKSLMILIIKLVFPDLKIIVQPAMLGGDDAYSIKRKPFGSFLIHQIMRADAIFSMNTLIKDSFCTLGYPVNRIYPVNNPIDTDIFHPIPFNEKLALRQRLGLPEDAFIFITSGVLSPRKNQSLVTEAFCRMLSANNIKNCYLIHMGPTASDLVELGRLDAASNAQLEERAIHSLLHTSGYRDRVSLVGYQKNPELYLQASDVFVHASCYEGKANVLNEAFACALPSLVPDIPLYVGQAPTSCSLFFEAGSPAALSRSMNQLFKNEDLRNSISNAAKQYILNTLHPRLVSQEYASFISRVAGSL